jgi:hypothetical protein
MTSSRTQNLKEKTRVAARKMRDDPAFRKTVAKKAAKTALTAGVVGYAGINLVGAVGTIAVGGKMVALATAAKAAGGASGGKAGLGYAMVAYGGLDGVMSGAQAAPYVKEPMKKAIVNAAPVAATASKAVGSALGRFSLRAIPGLNIAMAATEMARLAGSGARILRRGPVREGGKAKHDAVAGSVPVKEHPRLNPNGSVSIVNAHTRDIRG